MDVEAQRHWQGRAQPKDEDSFAPNTENII